MVPHRQIKKKMVKKNSLQYTPNNLCVVYNLTSQLQSMLKVMMFNSQLYPFSLELHFVRLF